MTDARPPAGPRAPSTFLTVAGVLGGLFGVVVGAAVAARGTTSAVVGGSLLITFGAAVLLSWSSTLLRLRESRRAAVDGSLAPRPELVDGEPATYHPRSSGASRALGLAALALMGTWALVMIVLALLRGAPGWLVLLVPWAVLVLGGPVLALAGRLAPGGVYVTPTRVVDVDRGGRAEIALVDVDMIAPMPGRVLLRPRRPGAVTVRRFAGIWGRRPRTDLFVAETTGLYGEGAALVQDVQRVMGR